MNKLSKNEMLKLTSQEIDDNKIKEFKEYASSKYGEYVVIPISLFVLSKYT